MHMIDNSVSINELEKMSEKIFNRIVKAVVDIEREIMVVNAELHADEELMLLEHGSEQKNLWGINFHPDKFGTQDWIEFDSMINLRPSWGNKSRGVDDPQVQKRIREVVTKLVPS